jgi:uncharacterized protein
VRAVSAISRAQAILLALFLCWAQAAFAEVAVPPLAGRVVDQTGTLNSSYIETLNQRIRSFEQRKGSQIAVLIVPTTQPETIEQYSLRVAENWKIGRKKIDDGALLVIAKNDHKLRIEVGYGLEGALTDVTARRIIDEVIAPHFKTGDFAGGISEGLTRMIGVIDGERLPAPAPEASHESTDWPWFFLNPFNPFTIIFVLAVGAISRSMLGRLAGSAVAGGVIAALVWFLLGSIAVGVVAGGIISVLTFFADPSWAANQGTTRSGGRRSSDSWSGGSSGGGWSSGSSSSSSSSDSGGGGGSFGGGGASGSW